MTAGQADFLFDVGWPHHFIVGDGVGDVATVAANRRKSQRCHFFATGIPGTFGKGMGNILGEDAHGVHPWRRDGGVMGRLKVEFRPETGRQPTGVGNGWSVAPFGFGQGRVDLAAVVRFTGAGARVEIGQFVQGDREFGGATFNGDGFHLALPGWVSGGAEQAQRHLGIGVGDHNGRIDAFTANQLHPFARQNARHGRASSHHRAGLTGNVTENKGDHPHAALDITPSAGQPAQATRRVMKVNRRCAGVVRTSVGADDALAQNGALQPLILQKMFSIFDHRPVEEQVDRILVAFEPGFDLLTTRWRADP